MDSGTAFSPSVFTTEVDDVSDSAFISEAGFSAFFSGSTRAPSSLCFIQDDTKIEKKNIHILSVPGRYYSQLNAHSCHAEQT